MRKMSLVSALAVLTLLGAGCSTSTTPTPAPAPAPTPTPVVQAPAAPATLAVGTAVLGNWKSGSRWWEAKVTAVGQDNYVVAYDSDKSTDTLTLDKIALPPTSLVSVKVGDKVVAKWTNGSWYGGTIQAVGSDTVTVAWSDGSSPSSVAAKDITLPLK